MREALVIVWQQRALWWSRILPNSPVASVIMRRSATAGNTASLEFASPDCNVDFNGDTFDDGSDYDDYVTAFENSC